MLGVPPKWLPVGALAEVFAMEVQDMTIQESVPSPKGTLNSLLSRVSVPSSAMPAGTSPFMVMDGQGIVAQGKAQSTRRAEAAP